MKVENRNEKLVKIPINSFKLEGILNLPERAKGIVIFAHGSGSSRFSLRNSFVARVLQNANFGTLLFDLLTREEDRIYENRFDINLLTQRLMIATKWVKNYPETKDMKIGYFGASTGAAAALQADAEMCSASAIVSRGGRPDLAENYLSKVKAPTLLIVGEYDDIVLELNRRAYNKILTEKKLVIIPKATHLFEEPGALEEVARLAREWFSNYLG
ncbi:MAG: alpha/beta hydrolase [Nitrososphaerales archaeon]